MGLFSGDFIFVGDIGRPDLLEKAVKVEGLSEIGAKQMFKSIESIKDLPDYIQIWPGHGAGSPCGKSLGAIQHLRLAMKNKRTGLFLKIMKLPLSINSFLTNLHHHIILHK